VKIDRKDNVVGSEWICSCLECASSLDTLRSSPSSLWCVAYISSPFIKPFSSHLVRKGRAATASALSNASVKVSA